jgi:fructan beta-fructosidase
MNEPHGPIEVDGVHHLFFQANPHAPHWGDIEWGHAVSPDLVHWRHQPSALVPRPGSVAPTGVWSGSSVRDDDGRVRLYVTAGDSSRTPDQSVAVARPRNGGWELDEAPLLVMPDDDALLPGQFRDPFVWRERASWFMLVGAGLRGIGGTALLYRSHDGEEWEALGPLHSAPVAEMWELPVLLPVHTADGVRRHVLFVCPWWAEVPAGQVVEVLHWVGTWDPRRAEFVPDHDEPRRFDFGRHFTGPSGYVTEDGRTILWSIAQDGRTEAEHESWGWAHNAGLPLELGLGHDGHLEISPVRELAGLRDELLTEAAGDQLEIELDLDLGTTGCVRLALRGGAATIEVSADRFRLERPGAAAYDCWHPGKVDDAPAPGPGRHDLRVLLDGSMLEAYLDRRWSFTTRVPATADGVGLVCTGQARVESSRMWRLRAADNGPGEAR